MEELKRKKKLVLLYRKEKVIQIILAFFACISIVTTFAIIFSLFSESLPFFGEGRFFELFKFGRSWNPAQGKYTILPILIGTCMIVLFSCLFAIPLGLGCAIYLSEYATPTLRNVLKPVLEILAGIPSVVYGFFALLYITPMLKNHISIILKVFLVLSLVLSGILTINGINKFKDVESLFAKILFVSFSLLFGSSFIFLLIHFFQFYEKTNHLQVETFNVLSASFAVGIMITPLVASLSEDALRSVPKILKEASLGLGATKFETVSKVTVPAAISGVISSFILAISRAIGETMVVAMAAGSKTILNINPLGQIQTMTGYMVSKAFGEVVVGSLEYQTVFVVGLILFFITLFLNICAKILVNLFREVY